MSCHPGAINPIFAPNSIDKLQMVSRALDFHRPYRRSCISNRMTSAPAMPSFRWYGGSDPCRDAARNAFKLNPHRGGLCLAQRLRSQHDARLRSIRCRRKRANSSVRTRMAIAAHDEHPRQAQADSGAMTCAMPCPARPISNRAGYRLRTYADASGRRSLPREGCCRYAARGARDGVIGPWQKSAQDCDHMARAARSCQRGSGSQVVYQMAIDVQERHTIA